MKSFFERLCELSEFFLRLLSIRMFEQTRGSRKLIHLRFTNVKYGCVETGGVCACIRIYVALCKRDARAPSNKPARSPTSVPFTFAVEGRNMQMWAKTLKLKSKAKPLCDRVRTMVNYNCKGTYGYPDRRQMSNTAAAPAMRPARTATACSAQTLASRSHHQ